MSLSSFTGLSVDSFKIMEGASIEKANSLIHESSLDKIVIPKFVLAIEFVW